MTTAQCLDAAPCFDGLNAKGQAQMGLGGSWWSDEVDGFGEINELQSRERQDAFLSSEGWKAKSKPASVLIPDSLANRHFNAAVFAHRKLFAEQAVDGFDGADFAAFDAAQGYIKDVQRARHLQADETGLDTLDDGAGARQIL